MDQLKKLIRGSHPDMRKMLRAADKQEFTVSATKRHLKVTGRPNPDGTPARCVIVAKTPSDPHAIDNARAQLRRLGVVFPYPRGKRKT